MNLANRRKLFVAICVASVTITYCMWNSLLSAVQPWNSTNRYRFKTLDNTAINQSASGYVVPCESMFGQWRRLGNQLFAVAAVLYAANVTGRRPALPRRLSHNYVEKSFEIPDDVIDNVDYKKLPCPCPTVSIDHLTEDVTNPAVSVNQSSTNSLSTPAKKEKVLMVCGYFQKYRYASRVEDQLRRFLKPKLAIVDAIKRYFDDVRPRRWSLHSDRYSKVGIHIRGGDVSNPAHAAEVGYTIPQKLYFVRAILNVLADDKFRVNQNVTDGGSIRRFQFLVACEEIDWCQSVIDVESIADEIVKNSSLPSSSSSMQASTVTDADALDIDVTYLKNHDAEFDMLALSLCDAVVMSTGTFGWWASWLADDRHKKDKTVPIVYYSNWPRPGSRLAEEVDRQLFFLPHWTGIDAPYFSRCSHLMRQFKVLLSCYCFTLLSERLYMSHFVHTSNGHL